MTNKVSPKVVVDLMQVAQADIFKADTLDAREKIIQDFASKALAKQVPQQEVERSQAILSALALNVEQQAQKAQDAAMKALQPVTPTVLSRPFLELAPEEIPQLAKEVLPLLCLQAAQERDRLTLSKEQAAKLSKLIHALGSYIETERQDLLRNFAEGIGSNDQNPIFKIYTAHRNMLKAEKKTANLLHDGNVRESVSTFTTNVPLPTNVVEAKLPQGQEEFLTQVEEKIQVEEKLFQIIGDARLSPYAIHRLPVTAIVDQVLEIAPKSPETMRIVQNFVEIVEESHGVSTEDSAAMQRVEKGLQELVDSGVPMAPKSTVRHPLPESQVQPLPAAPQKAQKQSFFSLLGDLLDAFWSALMSLID